MSFFLYWCNSTNPTCCVTYDNHSCTVYLICIKVCIVRYYLTSLWWNDTPFFLQLFCCQGSVLEESLGRLGGEKGRSPGVREALEYVCPQLSVGCLRLGQTSPQTEEALIRLDELGVHKKFKVLFFFIMHENYYTVVFCFTIGICRWSL